MPHLKKRREEKKEGLASLTGNEKVRIQDITFLDALRSKKN